MRCVVMVGLGIACLGVAGCAPQVVGQQVGQSLYNASVSTGNALATVGDRTGTALQNAGSNLRQSVAPPPPEGPPPVYDLQGYSRFAPAPQVPVEATPLN